jgi:hypothetical protein
MRAKALLSLAGAFIAAVALVSASGAATTKAQKVTRINVSTRAAVVHYLRSIHVNPKGAVIQRGLRNYAGARCPGKHWACASTKHTVVQITGHGGKNRFACTRSHCTVVQISGVSHGVYVFGRQLAAKGSGGNSGSCVKTGSGATTGTGQSCTILQSGSGSNTAAVYENSMKVSGLLAAAAYTASITQTATGATSGNQACVLQGINLDGSTTGLKNKSVSVTLDGHQSVTIKQDVAGSGANEADQPAILNSGGTTASCPSGSKTGIAQSQTITSTVNGTGTGTITQNLDNTQILCGAGTTTPNSPSANICLDIEQNKGSIGSTATGPNTAVFDQENQLVALANTSASGSIIQIQGNPSASIGGLAAKVNQNSIGGVSTFTATQNETQCEDAFKNTTLQTPTIVANCGTGQDPPAIASLTQKQYGPEGMGQPVKQPTKQNHRILFTKVTKDPSDSSQTGGSGTTFTVNQSSKQTNDTNSVQNNNVFGGADTTGNGTVNQNVTLQGQPKVDVQVGTGTVSGFITCSGSTKALCSKTLSAPKIETKPTNPTDYGASDASFTFSNADPTVQYVCKLDDATDYSLCTGDGSGSFSSPNLPSGSHTISVKTKDADNNDISANDASYSWVITPPDPTITSGPGTGSGSQTTSTTANFVFADDDPSVGFVCELDTAISYTTCPSTVSHGPHTLKVKAIDQAGDLDNLSTGFASYSWEVIPYLTFEWTDDGASSGWAGVPGSSSIFLTTGSESATTFAQFTIHDRNDLKVSDLASAEPSFNTDTYVGAPRYEIDLDNGDYLFGYPPQAGFGSNSWDINCGGTNLSCVPMSFVSWAQVQAAEGSATITDALIEADFPTNYTYSIADFTYDNYGPGDVAP